jgi:hypothetical protein
VIPVAADPVLIEADVDTVDEVPNSVDEVPNSAITSEAIAYCQRTLMVMFNAKQTGRKRAMENRASRLEREAA